MPPETDPMVEHVFSAEPDGGEGLLAIVVRSRYQHAGDGVRFFTQPEHALQVAHMQRPRGYVVRPHVHLEHRREFRHTQEVLVVQEGRVQVDFYTSAGAYVDCKTLDAGDVCVLLAGGHGLVVTHAARFLEVKLGPYKGRELDKRDL